MLRQPVRAAVLIILVAAAAFALVMRAAEYFIVTSQIESIGKYYRSIGYIQKIEISSKMGEIAELIGAD